MNPKYLTPLLWAVATIAYSQSVNTLTGARAAGVAYSSSTLADEWSLFNNVGGLAQVKKVSGAFAYEASPALPGANRMAAILNVPSRPGTAGIGFFRFGDALYNEQIVSGGFGNQIGITSLGIKVNYIQYHAEGFGMKRAWSINFGGITQITPHLSIGAYITNINQPRIATNDNERIPASLTAGIQFKPTEYVSLFAEVKKELKYDATIKGALEYLIYKKLYFRTGFNLQPNAGFFGLGFIAKRIKADYSMQYNHATSLVHQASIVYRIEKRKKENE